MCTSPLIVKNKYNGSLYEVPCRYCIDCLLERSSMLRNMLLAYKRHRYQQLFVTLSYDNSHVPYLRRSELNDLFDGGIVPYVYRDSDSYVFRSHGRWKVKKYFDNKSFFRFPGKLNKEDVFSLPRLVKTHVGRNISYFNDRIGILLNVDVQRLFKSLRHHFSFSYYVVGEYGENTFRPHWHILFYVKSDVSLDVVKSLIRRYWRFCSPSNMKFIKTIAVENYVSMYITKVSNLPSSLYHLQKSFAFYSRDVGRSLSFDVNYLDKSLHYTAQDKNGQTNVYLPNSRAFNILVPIRKIPNIPLSWHSIYMTFFAPQYRRCFHPYRKINHTLADIIDYSIVASELHTKLASQRLKEYLLQSPTVYSRHKLQCLQKFEYEKVYGVKPTTLIRSFLNNYENKNVRNYADLYKFNYQQNLNHLISDYVYN